MKKIEIRNSGITLVALVITIIILLILAGISIATLTGSGLFEKARLAEQESKNAQELEEAILKDYENEIGEYIDGNRNITEQQYENLLKDIDKIKAVVKERTTINFTSPSVEKEWVKIADYPDGYTFDNSNIISGNLLVANSYKYMLPIGYETMRVWTRTASNGIEMYVENLEKMLNIPGEIILEKIN